MPKQIAKSTSCENTTFVMFVQFGEKLRIKTFDTNDLKNTTFRLPKAKIEW